MSFEPMPMEARVPAADSASLASLMSEVGAEDDLYGNRVEWKFVLSPAEAAALRQAVSARLRLEEFVQGRRRTLMHSVYFDSPDFMLYRRAALTQSSLKFRLRTYTSYGDGGRADSHGFFECKIGQAGKKYKLRTMVPVVRAGALILPARAGLPGTGRLSIAADQRFMRKALRVVNEFGMAARLTVAYVRDAFVSEDGALRVTFDAMYRASRIAQGDRSSLEDGPHGLDATIVEIKFVGAPPPWLEALLLSHGLPPGGVSFSKFRHGVALTHPEAPLIPPYETPTR